MKRKTTTAALKRNREDTPVFADTTDLTALAAEQGVEPVADFDALLGDFWPEEESWTPGAPLSRPAAYNRLSPPHARRRSLDRPGNSRP